MGKKRTVLIDLSSQEEQPKKPEKKATKKAKAPEKEVASATSQSTSGGKEAQAKAKETEQEAFKSRKPRVRSQRFKRLRQQVDPHQHYSVDQAVNLLLKLATAGFDESVELHLTTKKDSVSGSVKLPHGIGKEKRIAIWDAKTETKVKKGKLDFDLLIAKPQDMATIAKYGKTLGPKGLMPNPKTGTISEKPEEAAKKLKQEVHYKTEKKAPLIHATIGKISFGKKKLVANLQAFLEVFDHKQILKASISSSMGPGIRLQLE